MPTISSFYGIVIRMFVKDHPPPHFHARYGEHGARFLISLGDPMDDGFPPRAARLAREWARAHRPELRANWAKAERMEPLDSIDPLP